MINLTNDELVDKMNLIHGNKFQYPNFSYQSLKDKVKIICPIHGEFKKILYCHINRKQGCQKCSTLGTPKYTHEMFMKTLFDRHGGVLPYEVLENYKSNKEYHLIRNKYGLCNVMACDLQRGGVGSLITAVNKTDYMIEKFKEKHNNKYDYEKYIYKGNREKGIITCKTHGDFEQMTDIHLMGSGCTLCGLNNKTSGFSRTDFIKIAKGKSCILYLIKCERNDEIFLKIGITTKTLKKRFKGNYEMPYKYQPLRIVEGDAEFIWNLELALRRKFKNKYSHTPLIYFKGQGECLNIKIELEVLDYLEQF